MSLDSDPVTEPPAHADDADVRGAPEAGPATEQETEIESATEAAFGAGPAPKDDANASSEDHADQPAEPDAGHGSATEGHAVPARGGLRRSPRARAGVFIGVLVALLGFAIAVQVRSNASSDALSNAREEDLIRILDDQNVQAARLRQQIAELQQTVAALQAGGDRNSIALQQAEQQLSALGVLLGTLPATGPGVLVTVTDPARKLQPEDLLDIVQELRGAGAEAIQFGGARVGASTSFALAAGGIGVDDLIEQPPYVIRAIGDPKTLDTALNIPGGVAATARAAGGDAVVQEMPHVVITALRELPNPRYASPSGR